MADKPAEPRPEPEAERRFQDTLTRMVNTPHKPRAASKPGRNKTGAKRGKTG